MAMSTDLYSLLVDELEQQPSTRDYSVTQALLGINWSLLTLSAAAGDTPAAEMRYGLCYSPQLIVRNLSWSGSLRGRSAGELLGWLKSDEPGAMAVGLATLNALTNHLDNPLIQRAQSMSPAEHPHLAVFDHFAPQLTDAKVAIIGRYPQLDSLRSRFDFVCIERRPGPDDLPETAAEWILPSIDWVFITASSIANNTLPHLLQLSQNATVVLMGPSMPWLDLWADFGVDYLAGVTVGDPEFLYQVIAEAGGTRIFGQGVQYRVLPLS